MAAHNAPAALAKSITASTSLAANVAQGATVAVVPTFAAAIGIGAQVAHNAGVTRTVTAAVAPVPHGILRAAAALAVSASTNLQLRRTPAVAFDRAAAGTYSITSPNITWNCKPSGQGVTALVVEVDISGVAAATNLITSVTVASLPLTLQGFAYTYNTVGVPYYYCTAIYTLLATPSQPVPVGTQTISVLTSYTVGGSAAATVSGRSAAYRGVGGFGAFTSAAATNSGSGALQNQTPNLSVNTTGAGFAVFAFNSRGTSITGFSGNIREQTDSYGNYYPELFGDAAGLPSVDFGLTTTGVSCWVAAALPLIVAPNNWNVGVAPAFTAQAAPAALWGGSGLNPYIPISATAQPHLKLAGHVGVNAAAAATIRPTVDVSYWTPLNPIFDKLGQLIDALLLIVGDSTAWGAWDTGYVEWTPGPLYGWAGRVATKIGWYYNANVEVLLWNYPANSGYLAPVTLWSAGPDRPTLTMYQGGWPGATLADYLIYSNDIMPPTISPDAIIVHNGYNEPSLANIDAYLPGLITGYYSVFSGLQATYPNTPILFTTQTYATATQEPGHSITFAQIWQETINILLPGETLPLSPVVQDSTTYAGCWVIDTQQAPLIAEDINNDYNTTPATGIHPLGSGHAKLAAFILQYLASQTLTPVSVSVTAAFTATIRPSSTVQAILAVVFAASVSPAAQVTARAVLTKAFTATRTPAVRLDANIRVAEHVTGTVVPAVSLATSLALVRAFTSSIRPGLSAHTRTGMSVPVTAAIEVSIAGLSEVFIFGSQAVAAYVGDKPAHVYVGSHLVL